MMAVQSLSQIKNVYGDGWELIPGDCDTKIFLFGSGEEMQKQHYNCETLPVPQNPGDEVIIYRGKEPLCDKVFDVEKRLKELNK